MSALVGLLILIGIAGLAVRAGAAVRRWHLLRRPQPRVLFDAHAQAYDRGFAEGLRQGHEVGLAEGLDAGYREGWVDGWADTTAGAELRRRRELARVAADALPLCWPDEHPSERAHQANRVTGELLDLIEQGRCLPVPDAPAEGE